MNWLNFNGKNRFISLCDSIYYCNSLIVSEFYSSTLSKYITFHLYIQFQSIIIGISISYKIRYAKYSYASDNIHTNHTYKLL